MTNLFTNGQYQKVKNERFWLITFKDGRRITTMGNYSFFAVMKEIVCNTKSEKVILVINAKDLPDGKISTLSWDIKDYAQYFEMQKNLF